MRLLVPSVALPCVEETFKIDAAEQKPPYNAVTSATRYCHHMFCAVSVEFHTATSVPGLKACNGNQGVRVLQSCGLPLGHWDIQLAGVQACRSVSCSNRTYLVIKRQSDAVVHQKSNAKPAIWTEWEYSKQDPYQRNSKEEQGGHCSNPLGPACNHFSCERESANHTFPILSYIC